MGILFQRNRTVFLPLNVLQKIAPGLSMRQISLGGVKLLADTLE